MPHTVRRIVTGHDADGKAIVASDEGHDRDRVAEPAGHLALRGLVGR